MLALGAVAAGGGGGDMNCKGCMYFEEDIVALDQKGKPVFDWCCNRWDYDAECPRKDTELDDDDDDDEEGGR